MASSSIAISASLHNRACNSNHVAKKQPPQARAVRSLGLKQASNVVTLDLESQRTSAAAEQEAAQLNDKSANTENDSKLDAGLVAETAGARFSDERWKKGTWDLNMFVKDGTMDWDALIVAEATRRKFLEVYPEASTNEDPVLFQSSIIPWWAWLKRSYLPEAELINGRAAMVGFFMAYAVDALTGLDVVGQAGNFVCKAGVFLTVAGVIIFRKAQDFENLKKLADEATLYDKQWQSSWQDQTHNKF